MRYIPYKYKLILMFSGIIIVPFLIIGIVTYFSYISLNEKSDTEYRIQMASQISKSLDSYFIEADRLAYRVLFDDPIMEILSKDSSYDAAKRYLPISDSRKVNIFLSSLSFNREEIEGISFILVNGFVFSSVEASERESDYPDLVKYVNNKSNEEKIIIMPPHIPAYYLSKKDPVFSLVKAINEPTTGKMIAIIKIDFNSKAIDNLVTLAGISGGRIGALVIQNENYVLFDSVNNQHIVEDKLFDESKLALHANNTSIISDLTGLKVVTYTNYGRMENDASRLILIIQWISLFAVAATIISAVFIAGRYDKPVKALLDIMSETAKGRFDKKVKLKRKDELGQLAEGFNHMVDELDHLVKEVYETRTREREAELSALYSQMNPHFICNTLEVINMMAIENVQFDISDMVSSLGRLLEYSIDNRKHVVLLKEEINFVKAYFHIIEVRYNRRIKAEILIDPLLANCLIPRLILQPLVENAVKHGLGEFSGIIKLKAYREGMNLLLTVEDDGKGMTEVTKVELEKKIYCELEPEQETDWWRQKRSGYALRNIHQRIGIMYGKDYGLSIDNKVEKGIKFSISLPLIYTRPRNILHKDLRLADIDRLPFTGGKLFLSRTLKEKT